MGKEGSQALTKSLGKEGSESLAVPVVLIARFVSWCLEHCVIRAKDKAGTRWTGSGPTTGQLHSMAWPLYGDTVDVSRHPHVQGWHP